MDLSIIIVNYNVKEFLQNLLHSIDKAAQNITHEIIIVDNASDDGSIEFLQQKFPKVKLIINKENLGFGKANNIGMKVASGRYFLLLNPDTLLSENLLQEMTTFLDKTIEAGMAGCKILNPDGTLQLACRRSFPGPWTSFCKVTGLSNLFPKSKIFAHYNLTYLDENQTYEVDAISGSFMMMRKEVYEKTGGFDEDFFMYGEDLDLCYRIQKEGYKVFYVHSAQIIHYKGESTKRSSIDDTKLFYDAMHLFVKKHFSTSLLVEIILQTAIFFRKFFAFLGKKRFIILPLLIDVLIFDMSLFFAEKIYSSHSLWGGFPRSTIYLVFTIPVVLQTLVATLSGVYRRDSLSVLRTFLSVLIGFFILSSVTYFFKEFAYSRAVLLITYLMIFFLFISWRVIIKLFFKIGIEGGNPENKRTLIVGINDPTIQIAEKLQNRSSEFHNVIGLIGLSKKNIGEKIKNFQVLGTLDNIIKVIRSNKINEIVFSSNEISYNQMMSIVSICRNENVEFKLIGKNLDFLVGKTSVAMLDDIPIIEIKYNISKPLFRFIKVIFDYVISLLVLFLVYPFIYLTLQVGKKPTDFTDLVVKIPSVLSGKCSLVGPNVLVSNSNVYLGKKGLTGLWYVEEFSGIDPDKLNIFYARNQSLWFDLGILGKTITKMWNRK
ncbi:MAG: glycosyltransferase [Ignavibacteriaceae bacterium]